LRAGSKVTAAQQDGADRFGEQEVDQMSEKENQNKRTVRRLYEEAGNEGRLEVLDEIAWPDHVEHNPFPDRGREWRASSSASAWSGRRSTPRSRSSS